MTQIAIVGEVKEGSLAQSALITALQALQERYPFSFDWVGTAAVYQSGAALLNAYAGIWSAPGGQFDSTEGALLAIRHARENNTPYLATCGGFQHTVMDLAQNVLGLRSVSHEEYEPDSVDPLIAKMSCSLRGQEGDVYIAQDSVSARLYQAACVQESFLCSYGLNPLMRTAFAHKNIRIAGTDGEQQIRILEWIPSRFFIATLFVPQLRSTKQNPHPLIEEFVRVSCDLS